MREANRNSWQNKIKIEMHLIIKLTQKLKMIIHNSLKVKKIANKN